MSMPAYTASLPKKLGCAISELSSVRCLGFPSILQIRSIIADNFAPGFLFALVTFGFFDATKYRKEAVRTNGQVAPEHRLYAAMFGSFMLPIGLFVSERRNIGQCSNTNLPSNSGSLGHPDHPSTGLYLF
jgi:hypothetical protein